MDKFAATTPSRRLRRIRLLRLALSLLDLSGPFQQDRRGRDYVTREIWLERIRNLGG